MIIRLKASLLAVCIWVLALLALVSTGKAAEPDVIRRTFEVADGGTLTVDSDRGSIDIRTTRGNTVTVEISREVRLVSQRRAAEILADFEIDMRQAGKDVIIEAEGPHNRGWLGRRHDNLRVHFEITVPKTYNLDLETAGGSITIDDLNGKVNCATSGGSLSLGVIYGPVKGRTSGGGINLEGCDDIATLKTSGGGIKIGRVAGELDAHTSGGSITVKEAGGQVSVSTSGGPIRIGEVKGTIQATTSGGGITATIAGQPEGDCSLKTSGGGITVHVRRDIRMRLNAKTSGGGIRTDVPVAIQERLDKNEVQGLINGEGPELYLRTSGGSIKIMAE